MQKVARGNMGMQRYMVKNAWKMMYPVIAQPQNIRSFHASRGLLRYDEANGFFESSARDTPMNLASNFFSKYKCELNANNNSYL